MDRIEPNAAFKEGTPEEPERKTVSIQKANAQKNLAALKKFQTDGEPPEPASKRKSAQETVKELIADTANLLAIKQQKLVQSGLELVDADNCPLCDTDWDREALLEHLRAKLESAKEATALVNSLNDDINHVIAARDGLSSLLDQATAIGEEVDPPVNSEAIRAHVEQFDAETNSLRMFVSGVADINAVQSTLEQLWWDLPTGVCETLDSLALGVEDVARRVQRRQSKRFFHKSRGSIPPGRSKRVSILRQRISDRKSPQQHQKFFEAKSDGILETLYQEVAKDFSDYYRSLNSEDEGAFEGQLIPSAAKLLW